MSRAPVIDRQAGTSARTRRGGKLALAASALALLVLTGTSARGDDPATVGPEGFAAAIRKARPGDVIRLEPGLYRMPAIANLHFATPVSITSADPAHPATFVGLKLTLSSGLRFTDLEFTSAGAPDPYYAFRVANVDDVAFSRLTVHGDRSAEAATQLTGFYVSKSSNVSITDSTFDHLNAAMVTNNNLGLTISRNAFSYLDKGGVEMGGCSNVTISDNTFWDFAVSRGTHPDAIQLYTAGTTVAPRNILIQGNLIYRGAGHAVQGIFIQDEVGTLPYEDLTIADNAVLGGMWNSIYVKHVSGRLQIRDNLVATWPGLDMPGVGTAEARKTAPVVTQFVGWIFIRGDNRGATVIQTGNAAQQYPREPGPQLGAPPGNRLIGTVRDDGRQLLRTWIKQHGRRLPAGFPSGDNG